MNTWGWVGTTADLAGADEFQILDELSLHHHRCMGSPPSGSQVGAWKDTLRALRTALTQWDTGKHHTLVLEYELPRERGRRPDVVVLGKNTVAVIEFKQSPRLERAYVDQVDAYARDFAEYHEGSHHREVVPLLAMSHGQDLPPRMGRVRITHTAGLASALSQIFEKDESPDPIIPEQWLNSDYSPLPTLVDAARTIFRHEPLPRIRRAESYGVNEAAAELYRIACDAREKSGKHLALVTGVPGAGKTLVGLKFVYESHFASDDGQEAIFLSGNGPLVDVLQYTLSGEGKEGRVFVRDVHGFLKRYGGMSTRSPHEHVWVYDEAQRAWDRERVTEKPGRSDYSEPEDFLRIGMKHGDWALMVGLIGEGQEIHRGEESGLTQWNEAIADTSSDWVVHCPARLEDSFGAASDIVVSNVLDLDRSLRSHTAEQFHAWVASLLGGELSKAAGIARSMREDAFDMLVTRDVETAHAYARLRYEDDPDARYGMLMSSQARLKDHGFRDDFYLKTGPWFNDGADSPRSCCALEIAATEFQCQGLELDLPIICWGTDLLWNGATWQIRAGSRRKMVDPLAITLNAYRVLLTRGRDGFLIVVPRHLGLEGVSDALVAAGCETLDMTNI